MSTLLSTYITYKYSFSYHWSLHITIETSYGQYINNISLVLPVVMMVVHWTCELSFPVIKVSLLSLSPLPPLPFSLYSLSQASHVVSYWLLCRWVWTTWWDEVTQGRGTGIHSFRLYSFGYTGITPHLFSLFFLLSSLLFVSPLSLSCSSHSTDPRENAFPALSLIPSFSSTRTWSPNMLDPDKVSLLSLPASLLTSLFSGSPSFACFVILNII